MNILIARVKAKTPRFFKKLRGYCITLGLFGTALMPIKKEMEIKWIPDIILEVMVVAGAVGAVTSTLTAVVPPNENDKTS